jgi:hypothetical protein
MLNMKKGLAIVLAAATALTFAPVSTLGLQGVVEAQAADAATFDYTVTKDNAVTAPKTTTASVDASDAAQTVKINIAGGDATNTKYKVTDITGTATATPNKDTETATSDGTGTITVTIPKSDTKATVATTYTVKFKIAYGGTDYGTEQTVTITDTAAKTIAANAAAAAEKAAQEGSATFGGVKTEIIATDNTTYSLVNSDVSFDYKGVNYTADQLKWYLTKTPSTTPVNMGFTQGSAVITESGANGTGKLAVKVANAKQFATDTNGASIVGVYTSGAVNKIVYSKVITVTGADAGVITNTYDAGTIATDLTGVLKNPLSKDFLDGIQFIGTNNKKLNGSNSTVDASSVTAGNNFTAVLVDYAKDDGNAAKTSTVALATGKTISKNGVYYETYYVPYTDTTEGSGVKFIAQINLTVSVNAGPSIEVKDGNFVYSDASNTPVDSKVIGLDLSTNKTFDLASHIYSSKDNTTYSYDVDTLNVTVSDKGVVTASKVGTAVVKITPKANGVSGTPVYVFFRVNQNANDQISVTGKDGDKATVLTTRQYNGNNANLSTEEDLAAAQVGYVQVEVTGDETADVKEALTVKGAGNLSFALADTAKHGESVDAKTGVVTIPHSYLNSNNFASYVFPVKVVSTETNTSALTTGYFYVVVDYADATVNGLQSSYDLGTSGTATDSDSWLNLGLKDNYGPVHVSSNTNLTTRALTKDDALDNSKIYTDDNSDAFVNNFGSNNVVERATVSGKTEHILVTAGNASQKVGNTYKVVTIKSVPGQSNYVTKIVNVATGKTIYETNGVTSGASIVIDKTTVVKVSVAHAPAASLNPKYDPAFTIGNGENSFNYNTLNYFVAATENPKTYEVTLIPSQEGTQIVSINPTQGRLSETDYSLVGADATKLAVKYDTTPVPAKVTGLKIANKKGAAVKVSWKNQGSGIKYRVYKKVGNGDWVAKNVSSSSTSLKVKKGAKVTVKVKAFAKSSSNKTIWGPKATQASKKTDKK